MEEYKDVMLSEPPSRFAAAPAVQSMSLENYKGILLCDRPTATGKQAQGDAGPAPFLPAGKGDDRYTGLQPSIEQRGRYEVSRNMRQSTKISKPSALTRHKKWLNSFSGAVKQMQLDKAEQQLDAEEKDKKLRTKQAEQRLMKRQALEANASAGGDGEHTPKPEDYYPANEDQQVETGSQEPTGEVAQQYQPEPPARSLPPKKKSTLEGEASKKSSKKNKAKPKWAMTEDEAMEADITEHDSLIEFADKLNFEKFIDDYEVREALAIMRDRVKEIADEEGLDLADAEKEEKEDYGDDTSSVAPSIAPSNLSEGALEEWKAVRRAKKAAKLARKAAEAEASETGSQAGWNNSTNVGGDKFRSALTGESLVLAEKLLTQSPSLAQIHTRHTLAKLLQDVTLSTVNEKNNKRRQEGSHNVPVLPPVQAPVTTIVSAESQATGEQKEKRVLLDMKKKKDHVQNLPYMYRCPSL